MKTRLTSLVVSAILIIPVGAAIAADPLAPAVSCKPDKTTGECAPGVCEQCCNAFIPDEACASCLQDDCAPLPPAHKCMPDSGTNKCEDPGVCQDCCSKYIPDDQCDACVDSSCPKPSPSWLPGKRWCFAANREQHARGVPPCGGCGLVFNTVEFTPDGPAVAHGTLNYTGRAWTYGNKFECINMAYQYDNRTGTLSFPDVATNGSVANTCLAAFAGHKCSMGTGPKLTTVDDWSIHGLSERQFTCIRDYLEFPDDPTKGCSSAIGNPVMYFSKAITQCSGDLQPDFNSNWFFYRETNGATSECRFV